MIFFQYALVFLKLLIIGVSSQHHLLEFERSERFFENFGALSSGGIGSVAHDVVARLTSSSFPTAVAEGIDEQCKADSIEYVHNLYGNRSIWALQMHESSGKLPIGFYGMKNYRADGLFDECLAIRAPAFDGQYCTVFFKPVIVDLSDSIINDTSSSNEEERRNLITIFQLLGQLSSGPDRVTPKVEEADSTSGFLPYIGFCLPSSCSAQDLGNAVAQLVGTYVFGNYSIVTQADEEYCFKERDNREPFDVADIAVIVTLSTLGAIVLIATLHESYRAYIGKPIHPKTEHLGIKILHCFSFLNNSRKLLSMKSSSSSDNLSCIHGIRFFSMCWVVLGHSWVFGPFKMAVNPNRLFQDALKWTFQSIENATVSVDTFFVMSGLLASYLLLKELERSNGKVNIGLIYLHRYLRLTLVYAVVLGFMATLIIYVGTGPNWFNVTLYANSCREHWWKLLLYINNLYPISTEVTQCMGQSWYLANDMQLFLVAPFLIYPLWRWRKLGLVILAGVTLASLAANFTVYAIYDLPPALIYTRRDTLIASEDYLEKYYTKPWTRAPPYLVGIWIGWVLYVTGTSRKQQKRLPKWTVALLWTLSTATALAIIYGLSPYLDANEAPTLDPAVSMTYGPLHRTAWALVMSWIIFACCRGYGGIVNRILSWKGFLPLGRLTYCVYLIHFDFINVYYAVERRLYYYTFFSQITTYFGLLFTILTLAFIVSSTVEASLLHLEKLILSPAKQGLPHVVPEVKNNNPVQET